MYDFNDVHNTSKDEKIRAWAVEEAVDSFSPSENGAPNTARLVERAAAIEEYVKNGKTT